MKKKRVLAGTLCGVLALGAGGGIYAGVRAAGREPVMVIQASELNQGGYFGNGTAMDGLVTSDVSQDIYLQDTETVSRVLVQEGDSVRQGDVLLEYDTTQTQLNLEREKLNREQIYLNIQAAQQNLKTLKNTKPVSPAPEPDPETELPWEEPSAESEMPEEPIPTQIPEMPEEPIPTQMPEPTEEPEPERTCQVKLEKNGKGEQEFPVLTLSAGSSLREYLNTLEEKEWKQFVPSAKGYVFGGWYQDPACTQPWDMDAPVTEDTVLYARWNRQYQAEALGEVTDAAVPYNRPEEGEAEAGTLLNPYRYLAKEGAIVNPSFMNRVKEEGEKALQTDPEAHIYFLLEVRQGNSLSGELEGFWIQDAVKLAGREFPENWRGILRGEEGILEETWTTPTETPSPAETPEPTETPDTTETPEPTEIPEPAVSREMPGIPAGETASLRLTLRKEGRISTAELSPGTEDRRVMTETDAFSGSSLGLLPEGGTYTKEELAKAIQEQEERLADLQLDLKQAELKIRNTEKAVRDGVIRAKIQGIVKKAGDPANPPGDGSVFLQVASTEGMYIRGGISELMLDQIREGDRVNVTAWESGTYCQAVIREISPYPDESGMFSGYYGTASASMYPFTAYVEEGGDTLISQEWVQLDASGFTGDAASDVLYLWKAFILEEEGRQYVYLRDEKGKLKKQEITTGGRSGEGYEVLSGVTWEDWLAFPYGKEIRNGAATREGTMSELYGY